MSDRKTLDAKGCADLIRRSERMVGMTGAGISTAAGIPDFRGPQGLYVTCRYDPDTVFDISAFRRDPAPFYEFTRDFLGVIDTIEPTFTHRFLAGLETAGKVTAVVTQNIDSLHQKAGSENVISVHGDYWTSHCLDCAREFDLSYMEDVVREVEVPRCSCGGVIKPDVVFYGEAVRDLERAAATVASSDLLLVLGSSLVARAGPLLRRRRPRRILHRGRTTPRGVGITTETQRAQSATHRGFSRVSGNSSKLNSA
jgi:NAD-dependent deacetylase